MEFSLSLIPPQPLVYQKSHLNSMIWGGGGRRLRPDMVVQRPSHPSGVAPRRAHDPWAAARPPQPALGTRPRRLRYASEISPSSPAPERHPRRPNQRRPHSNRTAVLIERRRWDRAIRPNNSRRRPSIASCAPRSRAMMSPVIGGTPIMEHAG